MSYHFFPAARPMRLAIIDLKLWHVRQILVLRFGWISRFEPSKAWPCLQCVFFWLWSRPLRNLSCIFSFCVPRNKWRGFTQRRLSQVWQTCSSPGSRQFAIIQDSRWVRNIHLYPFHKLNTPYPFRAFAAFHSQHSSAERMSTLSQNFCMELV